MREIRKSGLEGGAGQNPVPTLADYLCGITSDHDRRAGSLLGSGNIF